MCPHLVTLGGRSISTYSVPSVLGTLTGGAEGLHGPRNRGIDRKQ
jgi:hypothetical protein